MTFTSWSLSRTSFAIVCILSLLAFMPAERQAAASQPDPAVAFMQRVAKDLISAAKAQSPDQFRKAIETHGHYRDIAHFALGDYRPKLSSGDRTSYYNGMLRFIARYAANEAQKYPVSHAEIFGPATHTTQGVYVDSRVHMADGTTYDVRWLLIPRGRTFMVRDAQVLTFWMTPFLRDLFVKYITENNGQVKALVLALNQ
jgi:phospholipid transport system substrate-binding protein